MSSSSDRQGVYELAAKRPLVHPAIAAERLFEYDHPPPDHLTEIYRAVYKALDPDFQAPKHLARFYPREHGKSEAGTVVVPTWAALRDPNVRILILSETEGQAKGKLDECRDHLERLAQRFGHEVAYSNRTELQLERTNTYDVPTIKAAGFGTGITGGHFDLLVFDDVVSWETQRTQARREKRWKQFQDYLNLGSEGESVYLVLGTRKHPEDLYSHLLAGPAWDTRVEQAIADWSIVENGEYAVVTDTGDRYPAAEIGSIDTDEQTVVAVEPERQVDVLWPERWPLEALLMDMIAGYGAEQSTLVWKRENQNDATALQGQVLTEDMLYFVSPAQVPDQGLRFIAGVDVAVEDDAEKAARGDSDWWAVAVMADHRPSNSSYLVELERKRGVTMKRALGWINTVLAGVERTWDQPVSRVLVESNQAQRWLVQEARDAEDLRFHRTSSSGSKEERIISMASRFEAGRVRIVDQGLSGDVEQPDARKRVSQKWQSFVDEWVSFPTGSHDDRLDASEIALRGVSTEEVQDSDYDMSDLPT